MAIQKASPFAEAHVLVEEAQEDRNTGWVPPVPLEIASDRKLGHDVDTSVSHTRVGKVSRTGIEGAGSISVGEDDVPSLEEGQANKHCADLSLFAR